MLRVLLVLMKMMLVVVVVMMMVMHVLQRVHGGVECACIEAGRCESRMRAQVGRGHGCGRSSCSRLGGRATCWRGLTLERAGRAGGRRRRRHRRRACAVQVKALKVLAGRRRVGRHRLASVAAYERMVLRWLLVHLLIVAGRYWRRRNDRRRWRMSCRRRRCSGRALLTSSDSTALCSSRLNRLERCVDISVA